MFRNPFSFKGRIRRKEFVISFVIYFILLLSTFFAISVINSHANTPYSIFLIIPVMWFRIAQGVKRCHDIGTDGWSQFKLFYIFTLLFEDSHFGPNEYGLNPKGIGNYDEIDEMGEHLCR